MDLVASTPWDLTPMVPSAWNHPVTTTDNHQEDLELENEVLNKLLMKKAALETYYGRNQWELQIFEANLKNHFDIHWGYIWNSNCWKIAKAL